jgi:hypothetical protein
VESKNNGDLLEIESRIIVTRTGGEGETQGGRLVNGYGGTVREEE